MSDFTSTYFSIQHILEANYFTCRSECPARWFFGNYNKCSYQIDWAVWQFMIDLHQKPDATPQKIFFGYTGMYIIQKNMFYNCSL